MICEWWIERKKRAARRRFVAGYDYAVGAVLRGEETEESLMMYADNPFDDRNEFEDGMIAGLRDLHVYRAKVWG